MEFTKSGGSRKPVTIAVVGAGLRGQQYARLAEASGAGRVVAVAAPDAARRTAFAAAHGHAAVFTGWAQLAAAGRIADVAVVATQDRLHVEPAVAPARSR